jgi:hypothetical protein
MFFEIIVYTLGVTGAGIVAGGSAYAFYKKIKNTNNYSDRIFYEGDSVFESNEENIIGPVEYDESEESDT